MSKPTRGPPCTWLGRGFFILPHLLGAYTAAQPRRFDGALRGHAGTSTMPGMTQNADHLDKLIARVEPALSAAVERGARADRGNFRGFCDAMHHRSSRMTGSHDEAETRAISQC
jgi:hypothetical protein